MSRLINFIVWTAIWAAFFMFGLWLKGQVVANGVTEVLGYDYATFVGQFADIGWITYTGARHPGLGFVMSPVVLLGRLLAASPCLFKCFLIAVYATIGTANVWLVKRLGGWVAAIVFLCFGFTWILAAVPESFPVAMLTLLIALSCAVRTENGKLSNWAWAALFALCSAVTVTNGLKVVAAYLVLNKLSIRKCAALVIVLAIIAMVGCGFFAIRMVRWNAIHPEAPKTIMGALTQTAGWIPQGLGVLGRVKAAALNFFTVPVMPWFGGMDLFGLTSSGRPAVGWGSGIWAVAVYAIAGAGAWMNRNLTIIRVMCCMFAVDLLIHVVFAWGLAEGWIFCAHWFFIIPVCIGLAVKRLAEKTR